MAHGDEAAGCRTRYEEGRIVLDAWAPGRAQCVAEAVRGLVRDTVWPETDVPCEEDVERIAPVSDRDLLARALELAIAPLSERGMAPADVEVLEENDGTVTLSLILIGNAQVRRMPTGAPDPDGVDLGRAGGGWRCHAVVAARPVARQDEGLAQGGPNGP